MEEYSLEFVLFFYSFHYQISRNEGLAPSANIPSLGLLLIGFFCLPHLQAHWSNQQRQTGLDK